MEAVLKTVRHVTTDHNATIEHHVKNVHSAMNGLHHGMIAQHMKRGNLCATSGATRVTSEITATEIEATTADLLIATVIVTEIAGLTMTIAHLTIIEAVSMVVLRIGRLTGTSAGLGVRVHWTVIGARGRGTGRRETGTFTAVDVWWRFRRRIRRPFARLGGHEPRWNARRFLWQ